MSVVLNNRRGVEEEKLGELKKYIKMLLEGRNHRIFTITNLCEE